MSITFKGFTTGALACLGMVAAANGAVLQVNPSKDNTLFYSDAPAAQLSNGAGQHVFAGRTNQDAGETGTISLRRGLIAFDVSAIPTGSTINSVTVTLYQDRSPDMRVFSVAAHKLLADWGEGTSDAGGVGSGGGGGAGALATQNDATWLYRFFNAASPTASPAWTTPGAEGDYVAAASATMDVPGTQGTPIPYAWSGAGLVADVQGWVNGTTGNFGWLIKGVENQGPGTARRFESRQNSNNGTGGAIDARPVLLIDYTPVPEPTAGMMLLAGTLAIATRRRRRTA